MIFHNKQMCSQLYEHLGDYTLESNNQTSFIEIIPNRKIIIYIWLSNIPPREKIEQQRKKLVQRVIIVEDLFPIPEIQHAHLAKDKMAALKNLILPLDSQHARLHNAGGKGENLSKLFRAGFTVPSGFIITTTAYLEFVSQNELAGTINRLTSHIDPQDSQQLEAVSSQIREQFKSGQIAPDTEGQILAAYESFARKSVAVRSSATAEDLPGISFAGQQDTFLNINNPDHLIDSVISSWSSLWTARAIGYRERYNIPQDQVAMAVIIQEMVPSRSSGVLFTANPLTGSRSEMVIDAIFGLGELLVSGQVEPDHYLVDVPNMEIKEQVIGAKVTAIYAEENGRPTNQEVDGHDQIVLSDQQIIELVENGIKIADLFHFPQDVEWGIASGKIFILQSRPITTLFPLPEELSPTPLRAYFSFAAIQGVMDPITPLGQDALRWLFAGGASLFDFEFDLHTQPLIKMAGERLWIDITHALRNPLGKQLIRRFITVVDPGIAIQLKELIEDPEEALGNGRLRLSTVRRMLRFVVPFLKGVYGFARSPEGQADQVHQQMMAEISRLKEKYSSRADSPLNEREILNLFREIQFGFTYAIPNIFAAAGGGIIPFFLLNKLTQHLTGSNLLALEVTRGLPHNVTTEMDLQLWGIAREIQSNEQIFTRFTGLDAGRLSVLYSTRQLPEEAQSAIDKFMAAYGARGLGEIDLGRRRWREDPTYVIEIILNYLQIKDPAHAPDIIFQEGEHAAASAVQEMQSIARKSFAGRIKVKMINFLAVRVRELAGLRESPKFFIIQLMGVIREGLLDFGQQLVADGKITQAEDIFYLFDSELEELVEGTEKDWRSEIGQRKEIYQGELFRKQIPRLLLSDGRAFYEGISSLEIKSDKIIGSPVSPGLVEGDVRVVTDPINPGLNPGEIMVCQGTDPAWTPLFLTAAGVIMEVGGMMTHGAIVAREYGIPAVVGVSQATEVLQSGQRIRLNGSSGEISLL